MTSRRLHNIVHYASVDFPIKLTTRKTRSRTGPLLAAGRSLRDSCTRRRLRTSAQSRAQIRRPRGCGTRRWGSRQRTGAQMAHQTAAESAEMQHLIRQGPRLWVWFQVQATRGLTLPWRVTQIDGQPGRKTGVLKHKRRNLHHMVTSHNSKVPRGTARLDSASTTVTMGTLHLARAAGEVYSPLSHPRAMWCHVLL